jgi:GTP cyclohydrolase II
MTPRAAQVTAGPLRNALNGRFGLFRIFAFEDGANERAVVLAAGSPSPESTPLVRIHSQCLTGDVFRSLRCDCGSQLTESLNRIGASGCGLLIYQMQEGRGIGLLNKLRAYELQDRGMDTVEANLHLGFAADQRNYKLCAEVLRYFGVTRVRLLSNNPAKIRGLEAENISVAERIPLQVETSAFAEKYLRTKRDKLGHLL